MTKIKIHNIETGEIVDRDMTSAELAAWQLKQQAAEAEAAEAEAAKLAKTALLDKLGITADEAKLLLG